MWATFTDNECNCTFYSVYIPIVFPTLTQYCNPRCPCIFFSFIKFACWGVNPRYEHTFCDEDSMGWLRRNLLECILLVQQGLLRLVFSAHFVFLGTVLRAHPLHQSTWALKISKLRLLSLRWRIRRHPNELFCHLDTRGNMQSPSNSWWVCIQTSLVCIHMFVD